MALVHYVGPENKTASTMKAACGKSYRQGMYIGGQWFQNTENKAEVTCPKCAKALGIEITVVPPPEKNPSGVCACCFANQKVKPNGTMFKHGYERPGYGYVIGGCPGDRFPPYAEVK